ncbi:MAG: DUF3536 domain-containing protein [Deltaproteobacteria bacterium]
MGRRALCLHGHFYQPPRENPWLEEVEVQDSAAPFHDWNARITAECYGPNAAARLVTPAGRIKDIVDNYAHLSFNFGPTLLSWLEQHEPRVYERILLADRESRLARGGHGNAIAQAYNHPILPLAPRRDRVTQLRWGIADFERRFERRPEGLWLPEAAVDLASLEILADEGIAFTLLSPYQAARVREGDGPWQDAHGGRLDPTLPYLCRLPSGRSIAIFFYDGPIAKAIAFEGGLSSPTELVARLRAGFDEARGHDQLLNVALDGETFGHHKKGGDEVLALALAKLREEGDVELTNYGAFLEAHPPTFEVEIQENTSWSCAHGIERWRSDCGCQGNGQPGWNQGWRAPLRAALDRLRDGLADLFEREGRGLLRDPWEARDAFIELILDRGPESQEAFFQAHSRRRLSERERVQALRLLELQRNAMLMYTSCGWFFSELSGLETVQNLKYAARALQLAGELGDAALEGPFLEALALSKSNLRSPSGPGPDDGRAIYERHVRPSIVTLPGVVAHRALARAALPESPDSDRLHCYDTELLSERREVAGPATLTLGRMRLTSRLTQERLDATFAVLHFGGNDFRCGVRPYTDVPTQRALETELFQKLGAFSLTEVVRALDHEFTGQYFTLRSLFLDERRSVAAGLLRETLARYRADYQRIYEESGKLIRFLAEMNTPIPGALRAAAQVSLDGTLVDQVGTLLRDESQVHEIHAELLRRFGEARAIGVQLDREPLRAALERLLQSKMAAFCESGEGDLARELIAELDLAEGLELHPNLWLVQNELWAFVQGDRADRLDDDLLVRLAERLYFDRQSLEQRLREPRPAAARAELRAEEAGAHSP